MSHKTTTGPMVQSPKNWPKNHVPREIRSGPMVLRPKNGPKNHVTLAVYPGSFDPFTNGHLDILQRTVKLFDKVVVGILLNPAKKYTFSAEKRMDLISKVVKKYPNVEVTHFTGLLVEFAQRVGANVVIRGLRAVSDYEYEMQLASINKQLSPGLETIFFMAANQYSFLTSTIVREVARYGGDISSMVPQAIARELRNHFKRNLKSV